MYIIKDIISKDIADKIENIITDHKFEWYWSPSSKYGISQEGSLSKDFQFIHNIEKDSELYSFVKILLHNFEIYSNLKIKNIYRIKVNLLPKQELSEEDLFETIHLDKVEQNILSIVYYVSDSDGDTVIYDDNNIILQSPPVKGNAVCFWSNLKHRATPPKLNKRRLVINIVLEI